MLKKSTVSFKKAIPVWISGRENEMNVWVSLRTVTKGKKSTLFHITGHAAYDVKVDGELIAFGPAKCGAGYYRVDKLDLSPYVKENSVITVVVAGYNCPCGSFLDEPSFVCAELIEDGEVTAATGNIGFDCRCVSEHVREAQRYSNQRTFGEVYEMTPDINAWYKDPFADISLYETVALSPVCDTKLFIERECAYNTFDKIYPEAIVSRETFTVGSKTPEDVSYPGYMKPSQYKFMPEEVKLDTYLLCQNLIETSTVASHDKPENETITEGNAATYKWNGNQSGRICMRVNCKKDARLVAIFEEYITPENKIFHYRSIHNCVVWDMKRGVYELSTFEPYVLQALRLYVTSGEIEVEHVFINYFGADRPNVEFVCDDRELCELYEGAIETYRQNTFTIFMDCPSRERGGFLCDGFFTARVEYLLTGKNEIEHNFLENFFMPDTFNEKVPEGLFPCCYPSNGKLINNWVMWLVIELREYFERTRDHAFRDAIYERLLKAYDHFAKFENSDGLLEKLEGWTWVDGDKTKCAELIEDVNYPTNILYAHSLEAMGHMYGKAEFFEKAKHIKETVEAQSYMPDKGFYCENAVRGEDGVLRLSGEATETGQYYYFYFDVTTPKKRPELWERLKNDFGPKRVITNKWPMLREDARWQDIFPSNMLIGNQFRFALLFRYAEKEQFVRELKDYYIRMARLTNTFWEHDTDKRSCNHAFTSHMLCWFYELGMIKINTKNIEREWLKNRF